MELTIGIDHGSHRVVAHPQRARFMERRSKSVGIDACRGCVLRPRCSTEQILREEVDPLIHQVHHLSLDVVAGHDARHQRSRGTRDERLVTVSVGPGQDLDEALLPRATATLMPRVVPGNDIETQMMNLMNQGIDFLAQNLFGATPGPKYTPAASVNPDGLG